MFIIWYFAGFLTAGIIFTLFYRKNLGTLAKMRQGLLDAYEYVEDGAKSLFDGVDKKLDKEIEKRKIEEKNKPAPKPAPKAKAKPAPKAKAKPKAKAPAPKPRARKAK